MIILSLKPGKNQGELNLRVKAVAGKLMYEVQVTTTPLDNASWKQHQLDAHASMVLKAMTSGTHVFVRVRALTTDGPSPWSETDAHCTVP